MILEVGQTFGAWTVALIDKTGKRATVVCQCGGHAQVAVESLTGGESKGCGCRFPEAIVAVSNLHRPSCAA
jgi:hypothetical protein